MPVALPSFDRSSSFPVAKRLPALLRQHVCLERALMHSASVIGAYLQAQREEEGGGGGGVVGSGAGASGFNVEADLPGAVEDPGSQGAGAAAEGPGRRALVQAARRVLGLGTQEARRVLEGFELSYDLLAGSPREGASTAAELLRGEEEGG